MNLQSLFSQEFFQTGIFFTKLFYLGTGGITQGIAFEPGLQVFLLYTDVAKHQPFRLGHIMKVIGIEHEEDDLYGVIDQLREDRRKGYVPLCSLEVSARADRNFWPVREYVVWLANRS